MEDLGKQPQIFTWFRRSASAINTTINWRATTFWNSKTISQLNFERLLVTDFRSNDFSEISPAYSLYQ